MGVSPFLCGWTDRTPWKGLSLRLRGGKVAGIGAALDAWSWRG